MDNEEYARLLAKRADRAVKILKISSFTALAVFVGLVIYSILAFTVINKETAVIGFIVFIALFVILAIAVIVILAYAYYNLNKLKKIN